MTRIIKLSECEDCGRPLSAPAKLCRQCGVGRSVIDRLEEAAWKDRAWHEFTRIETALLEAS